jgi:GH25 family lysozyme M1 (1,4-beta-N-acetylmuramidase)
MEKTMILGYDGYWRDWTITDGDVFSPPDWKIAQSNGVRFVILKCADGIDDSHYFHEAYESAKAAGMLVGAYAWLDARGVADPKRQAEKWYSVLQGKDCPLFIDFEAYLDNVPEWRDLYDAAFYFKELDPMRKLGLYTNYYYYMAHGNPDPAMEALLEYNWSARYYTEPPKLYAPWNRTDLWQYSGSGDPARYGITNGKLAVDENIFMGTEEQLAELFGQAVTPPPQEETMNKVTIIANGINVRAGADTTFPILRQLKAGNIAYTPFMAKQNAGGKLWIQITESPVEFVAVGDGLSKIEALPGGEIKPVITFHFSADGYPAQEVTWTPS